MATASALDGPPTAACEATATVPISRRSSLPTPSHEHRVHRHHDQGEEEDLDAHRGDLRPAGHDADQHEEEVEAHRTELHRAAGVAEEGRMAERQGQRGEPEDRGDCGPDLAQPLGHEDQDQAGGDQVGDGQRREPFPRKVGVAGVAFGFGGGCGRLRFRRGGRRLVLPTPHRRIEPPDPEREDETGRKPQAGHHRVGRVQPCEERARQAEFATH